MLGVITGRDVLRHSVTIVREFGPSAYGRCLVALATGKPRTFLETLQRRGSVSASKRHVRTALVAAAATTLVSISAGTVERMPVVSECAAPCRDDAPRAVETGPITAAPPGRSTVTASVTM
jgi:hypothetical protein